MDGWLHSLLTNCPEITIQHMSDWILYQTALCESNMLRGGITGHEGESIDRRRPTGAKRLPALIPPLHGDDVDSSASLGGGDVDTDGGTRAGGCGGGEDEHVESWREQVGGGGSSGSKGGTAGISSGEFVDAGRSGSTSSLRGGYNGVKAGTNASVPAVGENADSSDEDEGQREGRSVPKNAAGLLSPVGDVAAAAARAPTDTERFVSVVPGTTLVTANLRIDSPSSCSNTVAPSPRAENLSRCSSTSDDMGTVSAAVRLPQGGAGGQELLQGR